MTTLSTSTATEAKKPVSYVASRVKGGQLIETVVSSEGYFQFARCQNGNIEIVPQIEEENERLLPPYNLKALWECKALSLPSGAWATSVSTSDLLEEIKAFLPRYADLPDEWLEPLSLYVMMTWVYDRFTALPYLRFLGEPGTGKTRLLQVCSALSYRALCVSGSISGAGLFRSIDLLKGTLAVDEGDIRQSEAWNDIVKVLNCGYSLGSAVIRCERDGVNFMPTAFQVFGPKIISTRHRFDDEATETRCLTFETQERTISPHIPLQLPLQFFEEALHLRNKLLRWRFDNYHHISAQEGMVRGLNPRIAQMGASLCAVAPDGEVLERLVGFLGSYDSAGKETNDKALVGQSMQQLRERGGVSATMGEITGEATEIAKSLGRPDLTAKRVGGILRSSFGLVPRRMTRGYVVILPQ